jgi:hypothetical protein
MSVSIGVSSAIAAPVWADEDTGWLGNNFFDLVDHEIVYDHWGYIDGFRPAFEAVDSSHHLLPDSQPTTLFETDLFIFTLRSWEDVANIPYRFSELSVVLDQVAVPSSVSSQIFDIAVNDNGKRRKVRIYLISLSNVGPVYNTEECLIPYIYATSLFEDDNFQLTKVGCKKGS